MLIWFLLVAVMLTAYVVLDGFDLGVGVLLLFVAKNEEERRSLIRSIGPVWDGNEVWLLAGGGHSYFAFPLLYASGFSGFYLPLMMVLWLLILRGVGVELRSHVDSPVWTGLFGGAFGIASLLLTIFYGAALGNVLRGVPLQADRLLLPADVDGLAHRPASRHSGLVHGDRGSGCAGGVVAAWRDVRGFENHWRFESSSAALRGDSVARGRRAHGGQPRGDAVRSSRPAG